MQTLRHQYIKYRLSSIAYYRMQWNLCLSRAIITTAKQQQQQQQHLLLLVSLCRFLFSQSSFVALHSRQWQHEGFFALQDEPCPSHPFLPVPFFCVLSHLSPLLSLYSVPSPFIFPLSPFVPFLVLPVLQQMWVASYGF